MLSVLANATKRERTPSMLKMTKFSEMLDLLKSVSAWDKMSLTRFGVEFDRNSHVELSETLITDRRWYDPETATDTWNFARRMSSPHTSLTLGYNNVIEGSMDITDQDLHKFRGDLGLKISKLEGNPVRDLLLSLVDLLDTESQESLSRARDKPSAPIVIYESVPSVIPDCAAWSTTTPPSTPQFSQPCFPQSYTVDKVGTKRKISDTSFGSRSNETTPLKLVQAEVKVQALQDTFIKTIINNLWFGEVPVFWVRG
jgi:hypothetical protein